MKIKLYESLMYLMLAIATGIFLVLPIALDTWRTILAIMSIMFFAFYMFTHKVRNHEKNTFLNFYLVYLAICVLFEIIRATNMYGYSAYEIFYALRQYLWIFLALPFYIMYMRLVDFDRMLEKTLNIVLFSLGLRTLTWVVYTFARITMFHNLVYEYGISWGRNGALRIDATPLIGILIVGLFYLYSKTRKKKFLYRLIYVVFYLLCVTQTRMLIIGCIACLASVIFFKKRKLDKRFFVQISISLLAAIAFDRVLNYLDLSSGVEGLGYRYYEFNYFIKLLENGNWRLGLGILTSKNVVSKSLLFGNLDTQMYLDDLGFLECFAQFGVLSLVMYILLYVYMIKTIMKCNKYKEFNYGLFILGLLAYIFVVSISMNLFGIQRSFSVSIILAITCSINKKMDLKLDRIS